jgi:hypothetical protein
VVDGLIRGSKRQSQKNLVSPAEGPVAEKNPIPPSFGKPLIACANPLAHIKAALTAPAFSFGVHGVRPGAGLNPGGRVPTAGTAPGSTRLLFIIVLT